MVQIEDGLTILLMDGAILEPSLLNTFMKETNANAVLYFRMK